MAEPRKLLSFVVPVLNEEENVLPLHEAVTRVMAGLAERYDWEFVFADNHSSDRTFEVLAGLARQDPRVRAIRFSRNFGYQRSIHTGCCHARGDAAIQLDCDLQDPPELVPEFVRLWEGGAKVVYGVRRSRREAWWLSAARALFYRLLSGLSDDDLPPDAGDFRLIDRRVLEELRRMEDSLPYLRGALAAIGFEQTGVPYDRGARTRGESKFSLPDLLALALDGILNHSVVPLRVATFTGLGVCALTFLGLAACVAWKVLFGRSWPPGFATTTVLILLSLSLNAVFLGVIGEYLGRIYRQVKRRPLTIIESRLGA